MLRSTQLRMVAIVLFAVAATSLTAFSARAFSQRNSATGGGGNSAFADPDEKINNMFGFDQAEPSALSSPPQLGLQKGKPNPFKNFHIDSLTSPPDPLSRPW